MDYFERFVKFLFHRKKIWLAKLGIFAVILITAAAVMAFYHFENRSKYTEITLERRETVAQLAASNLEERFNRLVDITKSLSTRVQFSKLVSEKKWQEAVEIMQNVPRDFPFIERVFLTDMAGMLTADTPALPGVRGMDFSFRDWFVGTTKTDGPYISRIYKRTAEPRHNVVAVSSLIKSSGGENIGVLVLQINLDTIFEWAKTVQITGSGYLIFTDREGQVAAHPKIPSQGDIVNLSELDYISQTLSGKGAVGLYRDKSGIENVIATAPVKNYGWVAAVEENSQIFFNESNRQLRGEVFVLAALWFFIAGFTYLVIEAFSRTYISRERERQLLRSIGDGVVAMNRNWDIIFLNKAAETLTGWKEEELIGKSFREYIRFVREKDRSEAVGFINDVFFSGKPAQMSNKTILIKKDKSEIPVGDSASPIFDVNGKVQGVIVVFRDVSKERETMQLRSDFTYAAHQFRTPVSKGMWSLELALETKDDKKRNDLIKTAIFSARSVQKMSDQLLSITRIDQSRIIVEKKTINLGELTKGVIAKINKEFSGELPDITTSIGEDIKIQADEKLLSQALFEILDNAVKYGREGSSVEVTADKNNEECIVQIRDSGIGILEEEQALVFTKFFRGHNFDTTKIPGAGLGLYIAMGYLKLMGGKVWFTSKPSETTFFIALPVVNL
ncbi:MAG: PAS domain S-box protein [Candidatus Colwellbacteria bacterium]|nr:PAS domain S-box protein [Candidatus Colwellbacteria bacterium]